MIFTRFCPKPHYKKNGRSLTKNELSCRICNPTGLFANFKSAIKTPKDYKFFLTKTFHETSLKKLQTSNYQLNNP